MDSNHRPHAYQACALTSWAIGPKRKAGDENRTRDNSLEGCGFTTKLHPQIFLGWRGTESNCRHMELQSIALPTELPSQKRSGRDSNPRPPAWQAGILTSWTTKPYFSFYVLLKSKAIAGAGFEPTTFGLWARRATWLLHPAIIRLRKLNS